VPVPFSPVQRARKLSTVLGTESPKRPRITRPPSVEPSISISKKTLLVIFSGSLLNAKVRNKLEKHTVLHYRPQPQPQDMDANTRSLVPASLLAGAFDLPLRLDSGKQREKGEDGSVEKLHGCASGLELRE
jgi:hypothetical protein